METIRTDLFLSLAITTLLLIGKTYCLREVALGKSTDQSSTNFDDGNSRLLTASLAVDGEPSVCNGSVFNHSDGSYSQTNRSAPGRQWWRVDLGNVYHIHTMSICHRYHLDMSSFKLSRRRILSSTGFRGSSIPDPVPRRIEKSSEWITQYGTDTEEDQYLEKITFHPPFEARHLAIYNKGNAGIALREVLIFADEVDDHNHEDYEDHEDDEVHRFHGYQDSHEESEKSSEESSDDIPVEVYMVIPLVTFVGGITTAIILYIRCRNLGRSRRRQSRHSVSNTLRPSTNETFKMEYTCLERRISPDLRDKLKDMYIDYSALYFERSSDLIGKGHFGNVYLGQLQLKGNILKTVAVKTLKDSDDLSVQLLESFLQEACFLKNYKHPNVLITLGVVWKRGDRPHVVLPYMALGDLCSLVRKPDLVLTIGDLFHFGMQIAHGMQYLTKHKCLHRDLAARNCLVSDTYLVKIADFGMSRDVYTENYYRESSRDKPKPVKWMAPESLIEGVYNTQSEVWAFGVLMWELLTRGSIPYPGVNNCDIIIHLKGGYRLYRPSCIHPILFAEIEKCWEDDPSRRPTFLELITFLECSLIKYSENPENSQDMNSDPDFYSSYTRNLTRNLCGDYYASDILDTELDDVDYVNCSIFDEEVDKPRKASAATVIVGNEYTPMERMVSDKRTA